MPDGDPYERARRRLSAADARLAELITQRRTYDPRAALASLPAADFRAEPFGVLLFQIIGQQISVAATRAILSRLLDAFDGHLPRPADLLAAEQSTLRSVGISGRKLASMRAAAQVFLDRGLDRDTLPSMPDTEVEQILSAIPGIGTWTVQGFLVIALDRPDAFPAGDLALRRAIGRLDGMDRLPTEGETLARAERWRPDRALAAGYLISWDALTASATRGSGGQRQSRRRRAVPSSPTDRRERDVGRASRP